MILVKVKGEKGCRQAEIIGFRYKILPLRTELSGYYSTKITSIKT